MSKLVFVLGLLLGACLLSVCKFQRDGERKLGRSRAIERGGTKVIHTFMYTHTLSSAAQNDEHRQYCGNITECGPCVQAENVSQTTHVTIT